MEAIAAISAIASITQLAHYAINLVGAISSTHQKAQYHSEQVQQRLRQLYRLRFTVHIFDQYPLLDTPSVQAHLKAIITSIELLNSLLEEEVAKQPQGFVKKYYRACLDGRKERRVVDILDNIENEKNALLLSISLETHAQLCDRIYNKITKLLVSIQAMLPTTRPAGTDSMPDLMVLDSPSSKDCAASVSRSRGAGQISRVHGKITGVMGEEEEEEEEEKRDGERPIQEKMTANKRSAGKNRGSTKVSESRQRGERIVVYDSSSRSTESTSQFQENKSVTQNGHTYEVGTFGKHSKSQLGNVGKCDGEDRGSQAHLYKVEEVTDDSRCLMGNVYDHGFASDFLK